MPESLLKALKWAIIAAFVVGGFACFYYADALNSVKPVFPGILSFGVAFIMSYSWRDLPRKIFMTGAATVVGLGFATRYAPMALYILTGIELTLNYFLIWLGLLFILGVPFMAIVFRRYD